MSQDSFDNDPHSQHEQHDADAPRRDHIGRIISTIEPPEDKMGKFIANVKTIVYALTLAMLIRVVIVENFLIDGPSMMPTLLNGDRVVVAKFFYGLSLPLMSNALINWGMPNPGDVIIVISPEDREDAIVKRVVGLPGDVIEVKDDVVYRNNEPIFARNAGPCHYTYDGEEATDECEIVQETINGLTYNTSHDTSSLPMSFPAVRVPDGHIYVLGDHRDHSQDSRRVGPIPLSRVKGRVLAMYWSSDPRIDNGSSFMPSVRWDRLFKSVR